MKMYENLSKAMETGNHLKNTASPKSRISKEKLLIAAIFILLLWTIPFIAKAQSWDISDRSTTGNSVTAVLNGNTLTISGKGNMADFWSSSEGEAPWWFDTGKRNAIQFVTIESGVTNIGDRAFHDCNNLASITISTSVNIIGKQAFYNCTSMYALIIPSNVKTIEDEAFNNCIGLLSIANMAISPQAINSSVFRGVTVNNIYLVTPKEATANYQSANFWNSFKFAAPYILVNENLGNGINEAILDLMGNALYFEYQEDNPNVPKRLTVYNGVADHIEMIVEYNKDGFPKGIYRDSTLFTIERVTENSCNIASVNSNGDYRSKESIAFSIPWTAKEAQDLAVSWTGTILDLIVKEAPDLLIENTTPSWIGLTDLIISTLGVDKFMPPSVKAIYTGYMAAFSVVGVFTSCGNMVFWAATGAGLPLAFLSSAACVASIYGVISSSDKFQDALSALDGNNENSNSSVTFTSYGGILTINSNNAFSGSPYTWESYKTQIKTLVIKSGVTSIPYGAFSGYSNLKTVDIEDCSDAISLGGAIAIGVFANTPIETLKLGRDISTSASNAGFANNTSLKTVTIGDKVTTINSSLFSGCGLTSLSIGNKVKTIGSSAFSGCANLTTNITFPNSVTSIGSEAFLNSTKLPSVTIPSSVTSIGYGAFSGCSLLKTVDIQGSDDAISLGGAIAIGVFANTPIETLKLGRDISTSASNTGFANNTSLKTVTIGDNVKTINSSLFSGCTGLTQIISNASTPPTLQSNTFYNVSKNIPVLINCDYLSKYQSAQYWKEFTNYQCAVQIVPASNSASVTFQKIDNAAAYTMSIYSDENHTNKVQEVHLDADGNNSLNNGNMSDRGNEGEPVGGGAGRSTQNALKAATTLSCTVSGLSANTRYYYSLAPYDAAGYMLTVFTGDFTTTGASNSIENIFVNQLSISPNPAKSEIYIKSDDVIKRVEIYSLAGTLMILNQNFTGKISISSLAQGVYVIKIYTDNGLTVSKITKD
jgi:hypothetical protein